MISPDRLVIKSHPSPPLCSLIYFFFGCDFLAGADAGADACVLTAGFLAAGLLLGISAEVKFV
jgi:hypothetical protein